MKLFLFCLIFILFCACGKAKKIEKIIEGEWKLEKRILNSGQLIYPQLTVIFENGDNGKLLPCQFINDTSVSSEFYQIDKKLGTINFFKNKDSLSYSSWNIDDHDRNNLITRDDFFINFWKR